MSDKLYLVFRKIYRFDESDCNYMVVNGVDPIEICSTPALAIEAVNKLNFEEFKEMFPTREIQYYRVDPSFTESADRVFSRLFNCNGNDWWEDDRVDFVIQPTEQDWLDLYDCFGVKWYAMRPMDFTHNVIFAE